MDEIVYKNLRKSVLLTAIYSFVLGSAVFFSYLLTGIKGLQIAGFVFNLVACGVNGIFLLVLFVLIVLHPKRYWEILQLMLILLFNVPVAVFYLFIATEFTSKSI